MSDLHGVPWLDEGVDQVQLIDRFLGMRNLATGLVAGEQTPATDPEVVQHAHRSEPAHPNKNRCDQVKRNADDIPPAFLMF